jgi:double-strand break repair protein MRE11
VVDLVIWGNEHECIPSLQESLVGTYRILQPGSSVACSLSKTESNYCPKQMMYFEIKERKFRMKSLPFIQIRQFIYDEISLKDYKDLSNASSNPKVDEMIKEVLRQKVISMITEARSGLSPLLTEEEEQVLANSEIGIPKFKIQDREKVLIRLRVDYEGFNAINHQRFGSQFIGQVANPGEILLLVKKRKEIIRTPGDSTRITTAQGELRQLLAEGADEEDAINRIRIEDLVNETLSNSKYSLSLLAESEMAQALDDYIIKKLPNAIQDLVIDSLERVQHLLAKDTAISDKHSIVKATETVKSSQISQEELQKAKTTKRNEAASSSSSSSSSAVVPAATAGRGKASSTSSAAAKKGGKKAPAASVFIDLDEDLDDEISIPEKPKAKPRGRAAVASSKKKAVNEDDFDDDEMDIDHPPSPPKSASGRRPARAAAKVHFWFSLLFSLFFTFRLSYTGKEDLC